MRLKTSLILSFVLLALIAGPAMAQYVYVDKSANGAGDGTSWANAYNYLQDALYFASPGDVIHVAVGTYYPDEALFAPVVQGNRSETFALINGVTIKGGFVGNTVQDTCCLEADPNKLYINTNNCCCLLEDTVPDDRIDCCQRRCACDNPFAFDCDCCDERKCVPVTILCGNIGNPNDPSDNSYHVVSAINVDRTAVLKNVVVKDGVANGAFPDNMGGGMLIMEAAPTVKLVTFAFNSAFCLENPPAPLPPCHGVGGGVASWQSDPYFLSCSFCYNSADDGGAFAAYHVGPFDDAGQLINCVFSQNSATYAGGAIITDTVTDFDLDIDFFVINGTFNGNVAGIYGGAVYNNGSNIAIYNSILWGDNAGNGPEIALEANNQITTVCNSAVQGGVPGIWKNNGTLIPCDIYTQDPKFVELPCDLRLRTDSPYIDMADNSKIPAGVDYDRDKEDRFINLIADLGAYELPSIIYVNANVVGGAKDGTSWANAYEFLQDALLAAKPGDQIWVAKGKYTPDRITGYPSLRYNRTVSFNLVNDVEIIGDFAGTETDITDKEAVCNEAQSGTILCGDLKANDSGQTWDASYFENSFRIIYVAANINKSSILRNVTVQAGYANGTNGNPQYIAGAGMYNLGSPYLKCVTFIDNWSYDRGGAVINVGGAPLFVRCSFINNFARQTGGAMMNVNAAPTIACSDFFLNYVNYNGGAMYNLDSDVTIVDSRFRSNGPVNEDGGAIASLESSLTICGGEFTGNTADDEGGAIYSEACDVELYGVLFQGNLADEDGGAMASILCPDMLVANCVFIGNTSGSFGGAMYNFNSPFAYIINSTFTGNLAAYEGGAIYHGGILLVQPNGNLLPIFIWNSILWGDAAPLGPEISLENAWLDIEYSILQGSSQTNLGINLNGTNLITPCVQVKDVDPLLVQGWKLSPDSPAIDCGLNELVPLCICADIEGDPRFLWGPQAASEIDGNGTLVRLCPPVDIGADEFYMNIEPGDGCFEGDVAAKAVWEAVGSPTCWCASENPRQCKGDADGTAQGKNSYWVSTNDLSILIAAWNKPLDALVDNQICADFDHAAQGKNAYRVSTNDLSILIANWQIPNGPAADCQD